jgi:hypothetical protein
VRKKEPKPADPRIDALVDKFGAKEVEIIPPER